MKPQDSERSETGEASETTEERPPETAQTQGDAESAAPEAPRRQGRGVAWLALLLALFAAIVACALAWQRYQVDQTRDTAGSRLDRIDNTLETLQSRVGDATQRADTALTTAKNTAADLTQVQNRIADLQSNLKSLQSNVESLRNSQATAQAQRQNLAQRLDEVSASAGVRQLKLAEVGFLVRGAYRALELRHDTDAAVQALTLADARLAEIDAPGLQPVRRALQEELQALKAVAPVDVPGLSARLHALIQRVPQLPLKNALAEKQFDAGALEEAEDRSWWQATQDFLDRYFTVRRTDQAGTALPAPETLHLLREQLQLKLEQARLALLRASPELYQASLEQSAAWIKRYFDTGQPAVQTALEEIQKLLDVNIAPALPNTGATLRALKDARAESR